MPTATFRNLKKEKQEKLIKAAIKEFSNCLYDKVSINRIIKDSDISRGSFYMYFENKEDLYFFILDLTKEKGIEKILKSLDSVDGDIFKLCEIIVDRLPYNINCDNGSFLKNVILNMDYLMQNKILVRHTHKKDDESLIEKILVKINRDNLNITTEEECCTLFEILVNITLPTLVDMVRFTDRQSDIKDRYLFKLKLLKKRFCKEEQ